MMRKVLRGGVIGGLPGMLIALVPLLLHDMNILTGDQSQIGFIGIPLMFLGIFVGSMAAASGTPYVGKVMLGLVVGLIAGIAIGVGIDSVLSSAGTTVAGIWFFLAPMMTIGGGVLGAWWGEHGGPRGRTVSQH